MIAQLTGTLIRKSPQHIVIDVNGVGYAVHVSLTTFATIGHESGPISLAVHTYVREDQLLLYGFASPEEKHLFGRLIGVSGIGPKLAMAILSGFPPSQLVGAITSEDKDRLSSIPGVGRKTAERIILDLKDKLMRDPLMASAASTTHPRVTVHDDALSALLNLGYNKPAAERALARAALTDDCSLEQALRDALKELMPQ